jgi:glycerophosphoryl diester phosphodiesterase
VTALLVAGGWDVVQVYTGAGLGERGGPPLEIVAHRGDLDHWPEDTFESIIAATELPVDGIEFDTIMSADGTWWVIHDATLDRTTDGEGFIPDLPDETIEEVRVDGGVGFDPDRHIDIRVPTLVSVLDALAGYDGMVYVDVQHAPTGDVADVVGLLGDRRVAILCRNLADSRIVKALDPTIETYLRTEDGPADDTVDGWLMESFFEADAGAVQGSDLPVITYVDQWRAGENEEPLIRRAWAIGVKAFLTKAPAAALAVREELMRDE